jgi:hypothetical protein
MKSPMASTSFSVCCASSRVGDSTSACTLGRERAAGKGEGQKHAGPASWVLPGRLWAWGGEPSGCRRRAQGTGGGEVHADRAAHPASARQRSQTVPSLLRPHPHPHPNPNANPAPAPAPAPALSPYPPPPPALSPYPRPQPHPPSPSLAQLDVHALADDHRDEAALTRSRLGLAGGAGARGGRRRPSSL